MSNWEFMRPGDDETIYYEDGTTHKLQPSDYVLTFGKYEGKNLEEVTDEWYIAFLAKMSVEKKDWFLAKCLSLKKK